MAKAEGKAAIDYGFHMIMRESTPALREEMGAIVREGVTSFKLFMAYPGVFFIDDAAIFRTLQRSGEIGAPICMHAENGPVIDVLVEQALQGRQHRAEVPRAHAARARSRPRRRTARSRSPRWPACPVYIVHLSAAEALDRGHRGARPRAARRSPRPARSTSSSPTTTTRSPASTARST